MINLLQINRALKAATMRAAKKGVIIFENSTQDTSGADFFYKCFFIPTFNDLPGKQIAVEIQGGIWQISVYCKPNSGRYDLEQLEKIDELKAFFAENQIENISISKFEATAGREAGPWFARDLSIYFTVIK